MYIVYAIKSERFDYVYVGFTQNIIDRLERHNRQRSRSTRPYAPFRLVYSETAPDRLTARIREKYLKSGIGRRFLKGVVENGRVVELADTLG